MYNKVLEDKIYPLAFIRKLLVSDFVNSDDHITISFVNPFSYKIISNDEYIVDSVNYWFSDGLLLTSFMRFFNRSKCVDRVSFDFSSIADDFFKCVEKNRFNLAIVGATELEIIEAVNYLQEKYKDLNVVFYRDGYFDNSIDEVISLMKSNEVNALLVGMGTPHQENFMLQANKKLDLNISITCGGFLTQTALKGDYYHPLIKKFGLRWLQRAILHKHVRTRLLHDYPIFIFSYFFSRLHAKIFGH